MNASTLFDALRNRFNLKNDAALCRKLGVEPPAISKARRFGTVTDSMILRIHEAFDLPAREIRQMGGEA